MQCATQELGEDFEPAEKAIQGALLTDIFHGSEVTMSGWTITVLPVKNSGIAILKTTQTAQGSWTASGMVTGHLVAALWGCAEFQYGSHIQLLRDSRTEIRREKFHDSGEAPMKVTGRITLTDAHHLLRGQKIGVYLSFTPYTVSGTEPGAQEWRDTIFLR